LFKDQAANMVDLLTGINNTKFDMENLDPSIKFADGIDVASWTGCINQTNTSYAVEVVVDFATEKSKPSYSDYANPKVVTVLLLVFKVDDWKNAIKIEHVEEFSSLNIVELEHTRPEHKKEVATVNSCFCTCNHCILGTTRNFLPEYDQDSRSSQVTTTFPDKIGVC
jgi:hypothetical protein